MKYPLFLLFFVPLIGFAQDLIDQVEPPFWWAGMHNTELQVMVHGDNIAHLRPTISYDGLSIKRTITTGNDNYLFIYLNIDRNAKPGTFKIDFKNREGNIISTVDYTLLARTKEGKDVVGYDNSDVMCLITPDRFANGDTANDNIAGMPDKADRQNKGGRHGGDIRGIIDHLDYFSDMGFTAIWLNPLLENKQEEYSYHGYSTTDYYRVDPRFGTNEEYLELAEEAKSKGIKIIMDMIMNHCGSGHWWMRDLPAEDWINNHGNHFYTSHKRTSLRDPYVSQYDHDRFADGWFVETMPDLNQRNPLLADYLIQNTIWWIEYIGLSGIRMDTYPYSDKNFMRDWTCAVMEEYPNFNICGEEWSPNPIILAYWQVGKQNPDGYTSCLPGLLDFPLQITFNKALKEKETWDSDMLKLYEMLSNDFIYADPFKHVIFPDNHDMSRIFTELEEDVDLLKLALSFYATMRGTPQFYYGTEIAMSNKGDNSHGNIRSDFPGGWPEDTVNAFTGAGLTARQKEVQSFVRKILNWRRTASAIHDGKLMHFVPQEDVYTYFRYNDESKVMVLLNKAATEAQIDLSQFAEILGVHAVGTDVISGKQYQLDKQLTIGPKQPLILEIESFIQEE